MFVADRAVSRDKFVMGRIQDGPEGFYKMRTKKNEMKMNDKDVLARDNADNDN